MDMKKRLISLCLALLALVAPASAAFSDISDVRLSQTASVLDALGIMEGVGGGQTGRNRYGRDQCQSLCQLHDFS